VLFHFLGRFEVSFVLIIGVLVIVVVAYSETYANKFPVFSKYSFLVH